MFVELTLKNTAGKIIPPHGAGSNPTSREIGCRSIYVCLFSVHLHLSPLQGGGHSLILLNHTITSLTHPPFSAQERQPLKKEARNMVTRAAALYTYFVIREYQMRLRRPLRKSATTQSLRTHGARTAPLKECCLPARKKPVLT